MTRLNKLAAGAALIAALVTSTATAADTPLPKEVTINGVEFVLIPEGWFYKTGGALPTGQRNFLDERGDGNVKVWLDSYYIAKYEARARDLVAYLNSPQGQTEDYEGKVTSCSTRLGENGKYFQLHPEDDLPATHLSWTQSDRWARWMGFRLPTEAEWEKAARGSDQRVYPWGDAPPDETYAGYQTPGTCVTWPVNSFLKGVSPYGVYNMAGNVREFVADWYNVDQDSSLTDGARNPPPPAQGSRNPDRHDGPWKILKGGRWASTAEGIRIATRVYYYPDHPFQCNGTRFGLDVSTVRAHLAKGTATVTRP